MPLHKSLIAAAAILAAMLPAAHAGAQQTTQPVRFTVRIENISTMNEFTASNGTKWTLDFSRGVCAVTGNDGPLFSAGRKDRGNGLKSLAEDGDPAALGAYLKQTYGSAAGTFMTAVGAMKPGGIRPGHTFEFSVAAKPGDKLYLAMMFGQSNDWFYAPDGNGIALFDNGGRPISGKVTSQIHLYDAGTEADEEPGIGPHQGPRQKMTNSGPPAVGADAVVHLVNSNAPYANVAGVMRVTVIAQ